MARQHRLYPEIVNQSLIEAAGAEVRLRETLPELSNMKKSYCHLSMSSWNRKQIPSASFTD